MIYFENKDQQWEDTAQKLSVCMEDSDIVLAPGDFVNKLPGVLSYSLIEQFTPDFFDYIVVHKGECHLIGTRHLEVWISDYSAVFANAVFVVFSKKPCEEIDRDSDGFSSLESQIGGLPARPTTVATPALERFHTESLDFGPAVEFLAQHRDKSSLAVVPDCIVSLFENAFTEDQLLQSSLNTVEYAIISIYSVIDFPYQDLKSISEQYQPIYSDTFVAVFCKSRSSSEVHLQGDFYTVIQKALQTNDYLTTLKLYIKTVTGERNR